MTINLNDKQKTALDLIRAKALAFDYSFTDSEEREALLTMDEVIFNHVHPDRKYKSINFGCSSCVMTPVKLVRNYILHHEGKAQEILKVNLKNVVDEDNEFVVENKLRESKKTPTLKELRKQHPNIKATSIAGFIKQLNNGK